MYMPAQFEETRLEVLHGLVVEHPLGAVVVHGDGGLDADHIPFEIAAPWEGAPLGTLQGHVARANPLWRRGGEQVMVLFQGPSAYVSPSFYEEKAASGKAVPTWNYAVAHAHGTLRAVEDPAWLLPLLERMSARHEAHRPRPWAVADAPRGYIEAMMKAIVGIEIVIDRMQGKWKASQNRSQGDRARIAAGLEERETSVAMARLMRDRG